MRPRQADFSTAGPTPAGWVIKNSDPRKDYAQIRLGLDPDTTIYLTQTSQGRVPCDREFDLFISPINRGHYGGHSPVGFLEFNAPKNRSLKRLKTLTLSFEAGLFELESAVFCGPGTAVPKIDYGFVMIGVIFTNDKVTPTQVFYYQVELADTREAAFNRACEKGSAAWWFNGSAGHGLAPDSRGYGVTDTSAIFGQPCLKPDPERDQPLRSFQMEILGRVRDWIVGSPAAYRMSKDLSGWKVSGLYLGSGGNGLFRVTTGFANPSLVGTFRDFGTGREPP